MSASIGSSMVAQPKSFYHLEPSSPQWIEVLVDCPGVQGLYTYSLPSDLKVQPGDIVSVPFGTQIVGGIAIRYLNSLPGDLDYNQVKNIDNVITSGFFPTTYWQLLQKVSHYYCTELITVIRGALPPGLLGRSQRRIRLKID